MNLKTLETDIKRIAKLNGIEPQELTKKLYLEYSDFTDWELRKFGGFTKIKTDLFGPAANPYTDSPNDLAAIAGTSARNRYVAKLQRELGNDLYKLEKFKHHIKEAVRLFPLQVERNYDLPVKQRKHERTNIVMISDTHFGLKIDPQEVEWNQYSWTVAARRLGKIAYDTAHFKADHREDCNELVICFAGDLGQGIIHNDDVNQDLITYQIVGTARMLVDFISYQLEYYNKVSVQITDDNHLRLVTETKGKGRTTAQKFDSFNTLLFEAVQMAFRLEPRVTFNRPKTPYTEFKVFGRTYLTTHADTFLNVGMPANRLNTVDISNKLANMNAHRPDSDKIQMVLCGHVHTGTYVALPCDVDLFVNPPLSGTDPYALSIGIVNGSRYKRERVGQWLIESTKEERVGDHRIIWAEKADSEDIYESIIKPYDYELVLNKVYYS